MRSWAALSSLLLLAACDAPASPPAPAPPPAVAAPFPPRCARCLQDAGPRHACETTRWCAACARDVDREHRCGRTAWCDPCRREIGEGHACGRTALCAAPACRGRLPRLEGGPGHVCGRTTWCAACAADRGPAHDCGAGMHYCPRCDADATDDHACGRSRLCPDGSPPHERALAGGHRHGETRWCRVCGAEAALPHGHK